MAKEALRPQDDVRTLDGAETLQRWLRGHIVTADHAFVAYLHTLVDSKSKPLDASDRASEA